MYYIFFGSISLYLHSPWTWKHLIVFVSFHRIFSHSLVSFQILVTRILNTVFMKCWWQYLTLQCFGIAQQTQIHSLFLFLVMLFREYEFNLMSWPTNLILEILPRTGLMCDCPLESRLRPTNPFCSCHKLTLNPGVLM